MWSTPENIAQSYYNVVKECLTNDIKFKNFKSIEDYVTIVGVPQLYQLQHFLSKIKQHPDICNRFKDFEANDHYGNPPLMISEYNMSIGTIRYIFSLAHLKTYFESLDDMTIAELGVGYGGLAFTINTFYKPKAYHLIDLPFVQQFASKYLNLLNIPFTTSPPPESVDLFISEFCISEFDDEDLYKFYEKYVKNAKNVFLMMNLFDEERKQRFIKFMNEDFNIKIYAETHGTHFPAYVIVGKKECS